MDDKGETLEAVLKEAVDLVLKRAFLHLCFLFFSSSPSSFFLKNIIWCSECLLLCFFVSIVGWFRFWVCDELETSIAGERAA